MANMPRRMGTRACACEEMHGALSRQAGKKAWLTAGGQRLVGR